MDKTICLKRLSFVFFLISILVNNAFALDPKAHEYFTRGVSHVELKQYKKSFKAFNRALRIDPNFKEADEARDIAYLLYTSSTGVPDAAVTLENIIYPSKYAGKLAQTGKYNDAISYLSVAIELDPEDSFSYSARGGIYLVRLNNYQEAFKDLNRAIELNPNERKAYYLRALIFYQLGNHEKSIRDCDQYLLFDSNGSFKANAYFLRGHSNFILKNEGQAIADFTKAIELNPVCDLCYYMRGLSSMKVGDQNESIKDLRVAAKLGNNEAKELLISMGIKY